MKFKRKGKFCVYIVKCADGTYYTGFTPNVKKRIGLHNKGRGAKYTRDRRPVKLVWFKEYKYFKKAFLEEKRIKRLRRKQKEEIIKPLSNLKRKHRIPRRKRAGGVTLLGLHPAVKERRVPRFLRCTPAKRSAGCVPFGSKKIRE